MTAPAPTAPAARRGAETPSIDDDLREAVMRLRWNAGRLQHEGAHESAESESKRADRIEAHRRALAAYLGGSMAALAAPPAPAPMGEADAALFRSVATTLRNTAYRNTQHCDDSGDGATPCARCQCCARTYREQADRLDALATASASAPADARAGEDTGRLDYALRHGLMDDVAAMTINTREHFDRAYPEARQNAPSGAGLPDGVRRAAGEG